jgi:hypothetical protein
MRSLHLPSLLPNSPQPSFFLDRFHTFFSFYLPLTFLFFTLFSLSLLSSFSLSGSGSPMHFVRLSQQISRLIRWKSQRRC